MITTNTKKMAHFLNFGLGKKSGEEKKRKGKKKEKL
jgi:hypothetical protein